ncbi:PKD domain-containing protein [Carboxylicivirga mesophila]|uniref:PKD domain-containing protein n=1 Tax=Carboxylicivirga mesophila TaxID=1166478 RepID=A0ABS5KCM9_9BACT|nr:PKD domain-containing protein [Carboxylicivirga mesophila]MBS2212637.1 PKD domain-containing protein [Carboxylicivirga mesophila]
MKNLLLASAMLFSIAVALVSCGSDDATPAPIVEVYAEASTENPYSFTFSTIDKYVKEYHWDFGDGNTSIEKSPTHTYEQSGEYNVSVTVKGDGGETVATKQIEILASIEELLSGGAAMPNGKTWVMSTTANTGTDGVSNKVAEPLTSADIAFPPTDNLLALIGLGDEYDNLYTFKHDGNYSIDFVNGICIGGYMYTALNGLDEASSPGNGLATINHTEPTNASWTLEKGVNLSIEAANEVDGGIEQVTVNFENVDVITFNNGGFIGLLDYTPKAIIREISSTRLSLTLFLHGVLDHPTKPSNLITITFDAQ